MFEERQTRETAIGDTTFSPLTSCVIEHRTILADDRRELARQLPPPYFELIQPTMLAR